MAYSKVTQAAWVKYTILSKMSWPNWSIRFYIEKILPWFMKDTVLLDSKKKTSTDARE